MQYAPLGQTDREVSKLCLGTMTFGEQNTQADAHSQLDLAVERGINFFDSAEMYPVPSRKETQGLTEGYIGTWLRQRTDRDKLVIATKISGPGDWIRYIRGGPQLSRNHIEQAVNDSLRRLQTDYIDLYQVHWPARNTNFFGKLGYTHKHQEDGNPIAETLEALSGLVQQGKVGHAGISNETPWGAMQYLQLAQQHGWPRIASIQNPYNLLNRTYEVGLAEISHRERVGLLAYSPLGFGTLTGKYLNSPSPQGARLTLFKQFSRYTNAQGVRATQRYVALAREFEISPTQMALAYVTSRPFVTSTIVGATTLEQLEENIASIDLALDGELLRRIEAIHREFPNPCP